MRLDNAEVDQVVEKKMIAPIRWVSKDDQERLKKKMRDLGFNGLVDHFLEKGWCKESAEILAKACLGENEK